MTDDEIINAYLPNVRYATGNVVDTESDDLLKMYMSACLTELRSNGVIQSTLEKDKRIGSCFIMYVKDNQNLESGKTSLSEEFTILVKSLSLIREEVV